MLTLEQLTSQFPRAGRVEWIGIRPRRHASVEPVTAVSILPDGLEADHRAKPGPRAVTLIQHEHLGVIAALAGLDHVDPGWLRRNLAVSGINLAALRGHQFTIGTAVLEATGPCAPCSRMEKILGEGGYNAMRGLGGITASVIQPGIVNIGDVVTA